MAAPKKASSSTHVSFTTASGAQVVLPKAFTVVTMDEDTGAYRVFYIGQAAAWRVSEEAALAIIEELNL